MARSCETIASHQYAIADQHPHRHPQPDGYTYVHTYRGSDTYGDPGAYGHPLRYAVASTNGYSHTHGDGASAIPYPSPNWPR